MILNYVLEINGFSKSGNYLYLWIVHLDQRNQREKELNGRKNKYNNNPAILHPILIQKKIPRQYVK